MKAKKIDTEKQKNYLNRDLKKAKRDEFMAYGEAIINSVDLAKNKMCRDSIEMNELPPEIR